MQTCRVCRRDVSAARSVWYPGWGRLCPKCDDETTVTTNRHGMFVAATRPGRRGTR